jgi:hypothetical protein
MATKFDANSWEFTQKVIRINHNRDVKKWFKDISSDTNTVTGRQVLKTCFLIRDEDSAIEVMNKMLAYQAYIKKYGDLTAVASIPEDWQLKVEAQRPQLVVVFRPTSKKEKSGYYSFVIPHYNGDKTPSIKSFTKGNYWARIILKDNSKIVINANTENNAVEMAKSFLKYVEAKYKTNNIRTGEYLDNPFKVLSLKPWRADYYPNGKKNNYPKWQHYF